MAPINKDDAAVVSSTNNTASYVTQLTPLSCEREPIHIVNRIQPCGTLLVVNSDLIIVQCSTNAVDFLPQNDDGDDGNTTTNNNEIIDTNFETDLDPRLMVSKLPPKVEDDTPAERTKRLSILNSIIGSPLSLLLKSDAVCQVQSVIRGATSTAASTASVHIKEQPPKEESNNNNGNNGAVRTFLVRTRGVLKTGRKSCSITQSGKHFLLEIEDLCEEIQRSNSEVDLNDTATSQQQQQQQDEKNGNVVVEDPLGEDNTMLFMQSITQGLRKCWSIEEMAGLVCSRIMGETPYDRGMVYRFDQSDGSGEVIYETTRWDARKTCRDDSFLGLRFPATDIPRQARELFMKNTLRFVYDVQGTDHPLYPSRVEGDMGSDEKKYTDLSMCRLRGSSHIHLEYLRNMKVTSTLVIAIIVNKRLWGLYSFHGYRHPIRPSARTRFLCEMASVMTSMVMESLTRSNDAARLVEIDQTLVDLQEMSIIDYMSNPSLKKRIMELLDVSLVAFRMVDDNGDATIHCYTDDDAPNQNQEVVTSATFDFLVDSYGQICKDYGVVFIDETNNPALGSLHTIAFFQFPGVVNGLDVLLSRKAMVELVEWGGDPEKTLESDGTLSPRSSFSSFLKGHLKKGKPFDDADKQRVRRFGERLERYRSTEVFQKQNEAIQTLGMEQTQLINDQKGNLDFFAFMAHELRTPFHGVLGSLEAMKEDPTIANNQLLNQAYMCGKNMIRILDDILLVAKGSYSLNITHQSVDLSSFLQETVSDMQNFAYMEGVSVRVRKEDIIHRKASSDFNRIRQVVHNLVSNAIKFSEEDINIEILQRRTFTEVMTVWKTYTSSYPNHEPSLKGITTPNAGVSDSSPDDTYWLILSVIDKGIGIKADDLKKLGTAFTQLSQGKQKKYQGTGLGITISNMIIDALHGQLVVFSAPEYGSCFTLAVPVKVVEEVTKKESTLNSKEDQKRRMEKLRDEFENFGLKEKSPRVLVVDDATINRKICARKVSKLLPSVEITQCANGKSCIEEYEHDHANIMGIFLDYHMPGMDGDIVARKIREFESLHEEVKTPVWIVGYTADILEETSKILLDAGMDSVMPKPEPMYAFEESLRIMMQRAAET